MRSSRRIPPPRSDEQILANWQIMELLEAVAAGQVVRGDNGDDRTALAQHMWNGEPVGLLLRLLADLDLVRMPLSGPPKMEPRGVVLVERAANRRLLTKFGLDPAWFRIDPERRLVELAPTECPNGHPYQAAGVLQGNIPCTKPRHRHRSWRCMQCDALWMRPGCPDSPNAAVWRGRPPS